MLRLTDSLAVSRIVKHPSVVYDQILITVTFGFLDVERSLSQVNGPAVHICCWSSPAQSILGPSPAGFVTIFHCLRTETPLTWKARSPFLYPPGLGWPSYATREWVAFSSPPTTHRSTVKLFEYASSRGPYTLLHFNRMYKVPALTT
jgi:hypothetical protein